MAFAVQSTPPDPSGLFTTVVERYGSLPVYEAIGAAVFDEAQAHLAARDQEPNKTGFPKQHFWEQIARGTRQEVDSNGVTLVFPYPMRAKVLGATIKPVKGKYLTIPAIAAAYGKRAGEFDGLQFAIVDGVGPALVTEGPEAMVVYRLVRQAVLPADPNALPPAGRLLDSAVRAIREIPL